MLVVVQLPVIDLRSLRERASPTVGAPRWHRPRLYPDSQRDFVRGIGAMSLRKEQAPWQADGHYIDARNSLRFESGLAEQGWAPIFRRLYREGLSYRLEVGLMPLDWLRETIKHPPWSAAEAVPALLAHFRGSPTNPVPLAHFGPVLAERLAAATLPGGKPGNGRSGLVAGTPAVIVESRRPLFFRAPTWHQKWLSNSGTRVSAWLLDKPNQRKGGRTRLLRLHISRMHADLALAEAVLAACTEGWLDGTSKPVLATLVKIGRRLEPREAHGYPQRDLMRHIVKGAPEHHARLGDVLFRLREHCDSEPYCRVLQAFGEQYHGLTYQEGDDVSGDKVTVTGDGNIVANKSKQQVTISSTGASLADVAAELAREIGRLHDELGEQAPDVQDTADGLQREAEREQPDPGRLRRRLATLGDAVGKIGNAGLAVMKLIDKLGPLIPS